MHPEKFLRIGPGRQRASAAGVLRCGLRCGCTEVCCRPLDAEPGAAVLSSAGWSSSVYSGRCDPGDDVITGDDVIGVGGVR